MRRLLSIALLILLCASGARAQTTIEVIVPEQQTPGPRLVPGIAPPINPPGPTAPGLYVGIKDQDGIAVSWVRVNGLKDRGEVVPWLRGEWGEGVVSVPLIDLATADFFYSDGRIKAVLRLRNGDQMHVGLANPYTELVGWWRQNDYSIPLSGVRQMWFTYIPRPSVPGSGDRYSGPPMNVRTQGLVQGVDLRGDAGIMQFLTARGEPVAVHFEYNKIKIGKELLLQNVGYLVGRTVRITYRLSAGSSGIAERELEEIELTKPEARK
ncbi:MAG: hypothetical protein FJX76_06345 [Armatimonadetes bacterium]|nr:hypothetical protein [Armatimonadota bacterium]